MHGSKCFNLGLAADQTIVTSQKLESDGEVDSKRGMGAGASGSQHVNRRPSQEIASERGGDSVTDEMPGRACPNMNPGDDGEILGDNEPMTNGGYQDDSEAWDGLQVRPAFETEATQLSPTRMLELDSSPLPPPASGSSADVGPRTFAAHWSSQGARARAATTSPDQVSINGNSTGIRDVEGTGPVAKPSASVTIDSPFMPMPSSSKEPGDGHRPHPTGRTVSTPVLRRRSSVPKDSGQARDNTTFSTKQRKPVPSLRFQDKKAGSRLFAVDDPEPSPILNSIPIPPLSLPTYLQLELSSLHPSPMYIHRSATSDFPYESSSVKLERLMNFLLLPPQLEQVLGFGVLACLDSWLYSFTILPLRFLKALSLLSSSWSHNIIAEAIFIGSFVYTGLGRLWQRKWQASFIKSPKMKHPKHHDSDEEADKAFMPALNFSDASNAMHAKSEFKASSRQSSVRRHQRNKSTPSTLLPDHKADILKGSLIALTCMIMMYFDPSRMYHGIRGQAAIKLYVIYNVLEVCDRLFSALGQDVLECLLSKETLERKSDGHSKVLRPFGLFVLALVYNLIHATALFYQVITLNVAVNSYSNALLTLLTSNQFVEIKSTVFKKFEKDNLFQITCADVVERFQLWLMLTIIACRNIVETGSLMPTSSSSDTSDISAFLPKAFTLELIPFLSGQVIGPYLIVLGSEMLVDWLKHAYITKFNMTKPAIYGRFLDVLCKDYYSNAFATQNLTRRLGLPVIPLACLFIRASVQTYHMFLATRLPSPIPSPPTSAAASISVAIPTALFPDSFSSFLNNILPDTPTHIPFTTISPDALLTLLTSALAFLLFYLTLLAFKLLLGMALLHFARTRYQNMKEREERSFHAEGRRVGGWGGVEVDEDIKRWIYADAPDGLKKSREGELQARKRAAAEGGGELSNVDRYSMVAKRIW